MVGGMGSSIFMILNMPCSFGFMIVLNWLMPFQIVLVRANCNVVMVTRANIMTEWPFNVPAHSLPKSALKINCKHIHAYPDRRVFFLAREKWREKKNLWRNHVKILLSMRDNSSGSLD